MFGSFFLQSHIVLMWKNQNNTKVYEKSLFYTPLPKINLASV